MFYIRIILFVRGVAQFGSAHDWGSWGRWFKSSRPELDGWPRFSARIVNGNLYSPQSFTVSNRKFKNSESTSWRFRGGVNIRYCCKRRCASSKIFAASVLFSCFPALIRSNRCYSTANSLCFCRAKCRNFSARLSSVWAAFSKSISKAGCVSAALFLNLRNYRSYAEDVIVHGGDQFNHS